MNHNDNLDLTNSNLLGEEFSYALGEEFSYARGKRPFGGKGKKILDKAKDKAKKIKGNIKKKVTKLKDKLGKRGKKFRNRFRGILRKGILKNIGRNVHGVATRLYPAVAPADAVSKARFKKPFVAKSKKIYSELLSRWKKIGGEEKDLNDAIITGSSKGIFKLRRGKGRIGSVSSTPLNNKFGAKIVNKSEQLGRSGADGVDEYSNLTDESLLSGLTNMSLLNASGEDDSDYFYGMISPDVNIYYGEDGSETSEEEGVENEEEGVEEVPSQEEVQKSNKGFMAWLINLFKKNKAEENPYEEDAPQAEPFKADTKEDNKNLPADKEATNDVINELDKNDTTDDAGGATDDSKGYEKTDGDDYLDKGGDKILGMPKMVAYGVGALLLAVTVYFLYRKMKK